MRRVLVVLLVPIFVVYTVPMYFTTVCTGWTESAPQIRTLGIMFFDTFFLRSNLYPSLESKSYYRASDARPNPCCVPILLSPR